MEKVRGRYDTNRHLSKYQKINRQPASDCLTSCLCVKINEITGYMRETYIVDDMR